MDGWVTYIHVANGQFMKAGKTKAGQVTRMKGSYNCLSEVIEGIAQGSLHYVGESLYLKATEPAVRLRHTRRTSVETSRAARVGDGRLDQRSEASDTRSAR